VRNKWIESKKAKINDKYVLTYLKNGEGKKHVKIGKKYIPLNEYKKQVKQIGGNSDENDQINNSNAITELKMMYPDVIKTDEDSDHLDVIKKVLIKAIQDIQDTYSYNDSKVITEITNQNDIVQLFTVSYLYIKQLINHLNENIYNIIGSLLDISNKSQHAKRLIDVTVIDVKEKLALFQDNPSEFKRLIYIREEVHQNMTNKKESIRAPPVKFVFYDNPYSQNKTIDLEEENDIKYRLYELETIIYNLLKIMLLIDRYHEGEESQGEESQGEGEVEPREESEEEVGEEVGEENVVNASANTSFSRARSMPGGKRKTNPPQKTPPKTPTKTFTNSTNQIKPTKSEYRRTEEKILMKTDGKTRKLTVYTKGARGIRYCKDGSEYKLCSEIERANKKREKEERVHIKRKM